jgi:predicted DNA-binding protein (MmcQ/YjbR family)
MFFNLGNLESAETKSVLYSEMVTLDDARKIALDMPGAVEQPHFEKASFRIRKKIFLTLDSKSQKAVVKLSESDQSIFSAAHKEVIYPVPGGWGRHGWTMIELDKVKKIDLRAAIKTSYDQVSRA